MFSLAKLARVAPVIACASAIGLAAVDPAFAQAGASATSGDSPDWWTKDVTVVTMAPGGAWGVATEATASLGIAKAIADCRKKTGTEIGCGAYQITIRGGWILATRCGDRNILAADHSLAEAKRIALDREADLRRLYAPNMPPCKRVLTVNPSGAVVPSELEYSAR